jgi:hypothetical protein
MLVYVFELRARVELVKNKGVHLWSISSG